MINDYKKLTVKYLKANKKKSILTIVGIILSVALISSIGLFLKSMQKAEIQSMKDMYGAFHIEYSKVNADIFSKVTYNPKVSRYGLITMESLPGTDKNFKLTKITGTKDAFELISLKVKEGRLPDKDNEIAAERWVLDHIDKNALVGSKIKIDKKEYTLVGILNSSIMRQYRGTALIISKSANVDLNKAQLFVEVSSKTKLKKAVDELEKLGAKGSVVKNIYLLTVEGAGDKGTGFEGLFVIVGIIIGIVVISTIAVIYNSFQISVVERIRQFGLLRAVGATPKQIRTIVLREAAFLSIVGIPLGLAFGYLAICGIKLVFHTIGGDAIIPISLSAPPWIMILSGFVGLVSVFISALLPAFFAGRISPLTAISGRTAINKEKIKRRRNILVKTLLGFEGDLASKNIKRNRKRYRTTVFSIVISVTLFITFKSFMDMALNVNDSLNESAKMHFTIGRDSGESNNNTFIDSKTIKNVKSVGYVHKVYRVYKPFELLTAISKDSQIKEIEDFGSVYKTITPENIARVLLNSSAMIYDETSLDIARKYIKSGSIDINSLNKENGVILINKNIVKNPKTKKSYYGPIADIRVGDSIDVQYNKPGQDVNYGKGKIEKLKVLAILNEDPFNYRGSQKGLKLITTEEVAERLMGIKINPTELNVMIKDTKKENDANKELKNAIKGTKGLMVIDNIDDNNTGRSAILMVQILMYGFVIVVSLIGCVNIINTLTTNIILRKREFATLKSIGLTQRGLKKMIVLEGLLYGIAGAVYGSIIGTLLSYSIFRGLNGMREQAWNIPWTSIAIAGGFVLLVGYIAVLSPLSRIKKENLIEVVREDF